MWDLCLCFFQLLAFLPDRFHSTCGLTSDQTIHCSGNVIIMENTFKHVLEPSDNVLRKKYEPNIVCI